VLLAGRRFTIQRQILADAAEQQLADKIAHLRRALLVMHSPQDQTVDIGNAADVLAAWAEPYAGAA